MFDNNTFIKKARAHYLMPLYLSVFASVVGELFIFLIFGLWLYPEGSLIHKFLWSVVFCGIGMGSAVGWLLLVLIVDRFTGWVAVLYTSLLTTLVLGFGCNLLCLGLDMHFRYFGGYEMPLLFWINGLVSSAIGGAIVGWLLFTSKGSKVLFKFGI